MCVCVCEPPHLGRQTSAPTTPDKDRTVPSASLMPHGGPRAHPTRSPDRGLQTQWGALDSTGLLDLRSFLSDGLLGGQVTPLWGEVSEGSIVFPPFSGTRWPFKPGPSSSCLRGSPRAMLPSRGSSG